jgi:hypothetical protein
VDRGTAKLWPSDRLCSRRTDRQSRQTVRQAGTQADRQTDGYIDPQNGMQTSRPDGLQSDNQTDWQTSKQADRQTSKLRACRRHAYKHAGWWVRLLPVSRQTKTLGDWLIIGPCSLISALPLPSDNSKCDYWELRPGRTVTIYPARRFRSACSYQYNITIGDIQCKLPDTWSKPKCRPRKTNLAYMSTNHVSLKLHQWILIF